MLNKIIFLLAFFSMAPNDDISSGVRKQQQKSLPIFEAKNEILKTIQENDVTIVVSETGSGKTTQIPQFIYEKWLRNPASEKKAFNRKVIITQPRRVAAISLAKRVASEMTCQLGSTVGYTIRFDDKSSADETRIHFMTDGMLLRYLITDDLLNNCSHLVLDEAHERTVRTDVLFGLVKRIMARRKERKLAPLKVIVMSATLNAQKFHDFFAIPSPSSSSNALSTSVKIMYVSGRQYAVNVFYAPEPLPNYVDAALTTIFQLHTRDKRNQAGDILVFLTGQEEIETCAQIIKEQMQMANPPLPPLIVCPLYASLPASQQSAVFQATPPGSRKVILSTNIAETSITISGIRYVIDTGLAKMRDYQPVLGMESLTIQPISRASARQRSGRAGREAEGTCYRLYTEDSFYMMMSEDTIPEILRCQLGSVILMLKAAKVDNIFDFDFIDCPPLDALRKALEELYVIGALDQKGKLTKLGYRMAQFPLEPKLARVLLDSHELGVMPHVIDIISLLSVEGNIFMYNNNNNNNKFANGEDQEDVEESVKSKQQQQHFSSPYGDHITLLKAFRSFLAHGASTSSSSTHRVIESQKDWCHRMKLNQKSLLQVVNIREQLIEICVKQGLKNNSNDMLSSDEPLNLTSESIELILRCFLKAFMTQVATLQPDGSYKVTGSARKSAAYIHPSSVLVGKKVPLIFFNEMVQTSKTYLKGISKMEAHWITSK